LHALIIRTAISPRLAMRIFDIKKIPLTLDFKKNFTNFNLEYCNLNSRL
jgi:hypothetical protein